LSSVPRTAPPVAPLGGWEAVKPFPGMGARRSFASGDPDGSRLRIAYFRRLSDGMLVGRAWFGPGSEGLPGHAHGGAVAAVLDEAMGAAAWMNRYPCVAARLSVDYRAMIPLGLDALFEAAITSVDGRKIATEARLLDDDGAVLAKSDGLFILISDDHAARFAALE
jgi:acyl-coenzyme A thioesterase PaaI-like protein